MIELCLSLLLTLSGILSGTAEKPEESSSRMAIAVSTVHGIRYLPMPQTTHGGCATRFTPFPRLILRVRLHFWMEKSGLLVLRLSKIRHEGNDWPRDETSWTRVAEFRMRPRKGETLSDGKLANLGVEKVVVVSALSPVPNPPRAWTSVRTIEVVGIEEEFRGQYKATLRNNSTAAIQGLAFRSSGGMSIGLRDEARLVPAGGTFTQRSSCYPGRHCELQVMAALSVHGSCTGEVEPCRLMLAEWRGRQIAAGLVLPILEEARRKEAVNLSELTKSLRALNFTTSLTSAATDILRSTRARAASRSQVEHFLLIGANGLVGNLEEGLTQPGFPIPPRTRNQDLASRLLDDLINRCRQVISNASPSGKERFRL